MQWVVVIKIYFVEKAEGGYISTMIQIIITISRKQKAKSWTEGGPRGLVLHQGSVGWVLEAWYYTRAV